MWISLTVLSELGLLWGNCCVRVCTDGCMCVDGEIRMLVLLELLGQDRPLRIRICWTWPEEGRAVLSNTGDCKVCTEMWPAAGDKDAGGFGLTCSHTGEKKDNYLWNKWRNKRWTQVVKKNDYQKSDAQLSSSRLSYLDSSVQQTTTMFPTIPQHH